MNKKINNICENCGFDKGFKSFLERLNEIYEFLKTKENNITDKHKDMIEWILKQTEIEELKCLSEKEKFLFGVGFLASSLYKELNLGGE